VAELQRYVDTLIVIPNQNLFRVANERTTFAEAFAMADQVLHSGVRSITDLMVMPGLINLDFADVRSVMTEMGKAMMGTGEAAGEDRALMASQNAIANPLLDEVSLKGARAVLVNVTGGLDMTLLEVDEAANAISSEVDPDANIIFGAAFDPALEGRMRVSVVATGMDAVAAVQPETIGRFQTARPALQPAAAAAPPPAQAARTAQPSAASSSRYARTAEPAAKSAPAVEAPSDATVWPEPARAPEPVRTEALAETRAPEPQARVVAAEAPPVIRIIDPSVEDDGADAYASGLGRSGYDARRASPAPLNNEPRQKGGWLSLFGGSRPRDEAPLGQTRAPAPARSAVGGGSAQPAPQQIEPQNAADDLEIPSFLRRLAN
jgi:cell division protein FtsZ